MYGVIVKEIAKHVTWPRSLSAQVFKYTVVDNHCVKVAMPTSASISSANFTLYGAVTERSHTEVFQIQVLK